MLELTLRLIQKHRQQTFVTLSSLAVKERAGSEGSGVSESAKKGENVTKIFVQTVQSSSKKL